MNGMVALGLVLGGGYLLFGRSSTATSASTTPRPQAPSGAPSGALDSQWNGFAAQAAATRDPRVMRYAAEQLRRAGLNDQAQALLLAADAIDAANQAATAANTAASSGSGAPVTNPVVYQTPGVVAQAQTAAAPMLAGLPPAVQQQVGDALGAAAATAAQAQQTATGGSSTPATHVPATNPAAVTDPKVSAAEGLTNHLKSSGRYREDKERVKAFQRMVGIAADGQYGVSCAIAIGQLGVIPAKPFYYSRNPATTRTMKNRWSAFCSDKVLSDPARADQWRAISNVERD
jgi:hypothetical protein